MLFWCFIWKLTQGGSQGGYILFVSDPCGNKSLVSWQSQKVRRVVKSTLAETLALLDVRNIGTSSCSFCQMLCG